MNKTQVTFAELIAKIVSVYGCDEQEVYRLIEITSDMNKGAKIARVLYYASDKADHTEIADHSVIIGFNYGNMIKDDKAILERFNVNVVDIDRWNYDSIDLNGVPLNEYKEQVRQALPQALYEMNNPKKREKNDQWLNAVLVFNWNTERLAIVGQGMKKQVVVQGEYKKVKSKPLTIAKTLIKKQANLRSDKYKRLVLDNLSIVRLQGEELQIQ